MRFPRDLLSVLLAIVIWPGCGDNDPGELSAALESGGDKPELLLYCGAGIRPPVEELVQRFRETEGIKVVIDFAGSQVLLSKIKLTGRGDLYMPGDKYYVEQAGREDLILYDRTVCYFVPTILVRKGNPQRVGGLQDLVRDGLKLGLGNPEACAIGSVSRRLFAKNKLSWDAVERNLAFQSLTVNELGLQIQSGALDAVIVWDALASYYAEHGEEVAIPVGQNIISTVNVGVLASTRDRELADRFVAMATSDEGKKIFQKHHYRVNPPERPE